MAWLKSVQNKDGGWGYAAGGASDTNSTSVVIGALAAAGEKPQEVLSKGGESPYEALLALSVPCDEDGGGAFAFQPDKKGKLAANADATAAGVLGKPGQGVRDEVREDRGRGPRVCRRWGQGHARGRCAQRLPPISRARSPRTAT